MKPITLDKPNRGAPLGDRTGIRLSSGNKLVVEFGEDIGYVFEYLGPDRHDTNFGNFRVDEVDGAEGVSVGAVVRLQISATVRMAHCIIT